MISQQVATIADFLYHSSQATPDKTALIFNDKHYSYKQLKQLADGVTGYVLDHIQPGEVVGMLLPNSVELVATYLGVLQARGIVLLLPANISDQRLQFQIEQTHPKLMISLPVYANKLRRTNVLKDGNYVDATSLTAAKGKSLTPLAKPDDISTIIFTSGTTGVSKGVTLRHRQVVQATRNIVEFLDWQPDDVDVNISALSHSFGLGHIHCSLAVGGTTTLFRDAINLKKILATIVEQKATTLGAVPAILRLLLQNFKQELAACDPYLRFVQTNTSLLEPELIKGMVKTLPTTNFSYYYGLSEASRSTFINLNQHPDKIASVGSASPNVELKIVDNLNKRLAANHVGEICIKGPHVIDQYWHNPQANKRIKHGWLHTGDAGYLDKDGYLYFKGRKDDIINVAGEKVSPEEIEDVVNRLPQVQDVAAIGISDQLLGEAICLYVSVSDPIDGQQILHYCRIHLERYKVPKQIKFVEVIPRTDNGKLKRKELREGEKKINV